MKRMQAIVSGKKKQCTKLPTPAQKGKKGVGTPPSATPTATQTTPTTHQTTPSSGSANKSPGKDSSAGSKGAGSKLPVGAAASTASIASSADTGTSTITGGSNSSGSSGQRVPSRIPASSPKKSSKDASSATPPGKGRTRQDSESKSKSRGKSDSSNSGKRFLRDRQKSSAPEVSAGRSRHQGTSEDAKGLSGTQKVNSEQRPTKRELFSEGNRKTVVIDGHQHSMDGSPPREVMVEGQGHRKEHVGGERGILVTRHHSDAEVYSGKHAHFRNTPTVPTTGNPPPSITSHAPPKPVPGSSESVYGYHKQVSTGGSTGHLKDSSTYESIAGLGLGGQYLTNYGSVDPQPGPHDPHGVYGRVAARPPSRTSTRSGSDQLYQQGYGSLPRSSRSTTPTADAAMSSYGSLPRGSNASTPTPQSAAAAAAAFYNVNTAHGWAALARKAESDSGFLYNSLDRHQQGRDRNYHHHPHHPHPHHIQNGTNISNNGNTNYAMQQPGGQNSQHHNYAVINYHNKIYGVVNHSYQPPRPGSVPPPDSCGDTSSDSLYGSVPRPGSVPPHYYSDSEAGGSGGYYRLPVARGSIGQGYESETSVYAAAGSRQAARNYESDSGYGTRSSAGGASGLRVHPDDERYRAAPGRRPVPRRHTVGVAQNKARSRGDPETERKREAFMQLLAQRYPQYADKIQGKAPPPGGSQQATLEKPARSRDGQRRRTAVVTYDPHQASNTLEYDDLGTMSDLELPSFQRGGFMRTSLPIVRSASTSLERPLGLVFLVSGDQTKRALLPNEITTLDTVRALFVRAFPDLTLEMLESPRRKIYILDPATSIYFQLEDLAEIKDRSVLKIHETDSDEPQKVKERQEIRGRTVQMPTSRPHSRQGYAEVPAGPTEVFSKSASLPPQAAHVYSDMMQDQRMPYEVDRRSRSRTPEPAERPRSLSAGASSRQRYSHSPDRLPTPERGLSLNPIPENRQLTPGYREQPPGFYDPAYRGGPAYPNAIYDAPGAYQGYAPSSPAPQGQAYVARSTRAAPLAHPQRAVAPASDMREPGVRGSNRHSLAFAPMSPASAAGDQGGFQRTQSYRQPPTERDGVELARSHSVTPADDMTRNRIEKMEAQLASLTAWVHYQKADPAPRDVTPPPRSLGSITSTSDSSDTFPASSASKDKGENAPPISALATTNHVVPQQGLSSDIPDGPHHLHTHRSSGESTPLSAQAEVGAKLAQLKSDLQVLRRQQQLNMEAVRDELSNTFAQIKSVLSCVPGAENQVNVHKRVGALQVKTTYLSDKQQVDKELGDLEASVEELRTDVISRQCRVNNADVEGMALLLSNITKNLADLKARFPEIHEQMKEVMDSELRLVVSEEKFLKEEPNEIENSLKRCKKLTGTLYTLKRLASVQDHRPPQVPNMAAAPVQEVPDADPKSAVLENIKALVPDHDQRVQHMEAAEAARERKKKISTQQEALKFGKSLEMASKNLRPPSAAGDRITEGVSDVPVSQVTTSHPSVSKPAVPSKPSSLTAYSSSSSAPTYSSAASTSSLPSASTATVTTAASVTTAPSVSCPKPSFTAALTSTGKTTDKPTATVSAMTSANTPATNTVSTIAASQHGPSVVRAVSLPLTETTGRLSSNVQSGTGAVTHTVKVGTETGHKSDMSVSTFPTVSPSSPVKPPVFTKPGNLVKSPTREKPLSVTFSDKPSSEGVQLRPKTEVSKSVASTVTTAVAEAGPTARVSPPNGDVRASQKEVNGHPDDLPTVEKVDLATQKQAARSAFFSSMNTPPTSPDMHSPNRNSALLDPSPVVRPGPVATVNAGGVVGKVTPGPTINLVLSGTASPKSPTNPGSFSISPPKDLASPPPPNSNTTTITSSSKTVTSPLSSPSRSSIPMLVADKSDDPPPPPPPLSSTELLSVDTSAAGEVTMRHKKVPPPPPPRKGSRPTSANLSPVNGGLSSTVLRPQSEETPPRFVGGVLGQHRLSGGPLSSTPKPIPQQNPLSKFEKDIATGLYANLNRPDLQNQKSSPQHMLSEAKAPAIQAQSDSKRDSTLSRNSRGSIRNSKVGIDEYPMPPPPHMTMALDREERGSSSESTSSSSGTSMGSQQSVVSVVRSASNAQAPANKPKPEPPRRHSSLLAKFTGSRDSKSSINNGKANVNGVDL
ncbi:serine/arginine repetitive matrix protein 2 [Aplysia californica]|uniref:Serine/arginine repetitive matrix protein 2 n=1 Tax=Aplysia californica TaxID=6500 RepID=A0ABM1A462_APLCA|nr:serine/arginine repetitive matrix protein 2 [Aplysia californica]